MINLFSSSSSCREWNSCADYNEDNFFSSDNFSTDHDCQTELNGSILNSDNCNAFDNEGKDPANDIENFNVLDNDS